MIRLKFFLSQVGCGVLPSSLFQGEKVELNPESLRSASGKIIGVGYVEGFGALSVFKNGMATFQSAEAGIEISSSDLLLAEVSPSGDWIAAVSKGKIIVVSSRDVTRRFETNEIKTRVSDLVFGFDEKSILVSGIDSRVYRWKFQESGSVARPSLERYVGHGSVVSSVSTVRYSPVFFSTDWSGVLSAWLPYDADRFGGEFDENVFGSKIFSENKLNRKSASRENMPPIEHLSSSDLFIFAGTQDGTIEQWQIRGFRKRGEVKAHGGSVISLDVTRGGIVASLSRSGEIKIWNGSIAGNLAEIEHHLLEGATKVRFGKVGSNKAELLVVVDSAKQKSSIEKLIVNF